MNSKVRVFLCIFCLVGCVVSFGQYKDRIDVYGPNPYYWEYNGGPIMLLGGSSQDNLFQIPGLQDELDLLVSVGGNYLRCTMSGRDPGDAPPFYKDPGTGKYDLNTFNPEFWSRFSDFLQMTYERDIVISIEVWAQYDVRDDSNPDNWWNPSKNINFTPAQAATISLPNSFFVSNPPTGLYYQYQTAFADKVLELSLPYPHVVYVATNESMWGNPWGDYWVNYIRAKAAQAGVSPIHTTEMYNPNDLASATHQFAYDRPGTYTFLEISQNSRSFDQTHWDRIQYARNYIAGASSIRPMNNVKIYGGMDEGWGSGTAEDGIERFWRDVIGGCASARSHRPPYGIALNEQSQAIIASARMLLDRIDIFQSTPNANSSLLGNRTSDEAYLTYKTDDFYAVYFTNGGSVTLNLDGTTGPFGLEWLDVLDTAWISPQVINGNQTITLTAPGTGPWVAYVGDPDSISPLTCAMAIASGQKLKYDLSGPEGIPDCYVDIYDMESLAADWLYCNDPEDPDCFNPYAGMGDITEGLIARWEFEDNYLDTSGYGAAANGTAVGDVTIVSDASRGKVLSIRPNATSLTAPYGYVDCGNNTKLDLTTAMTVSFWYKDAAFDEDLDSAWRRIVTKGEYGWAIQQAAYGFSGLGISAAEDNQIQFHCRLGSLYQWTTASPESYTDEVWAHVACVFDSSTGTQKIYIDGDLARQQTDSGTIGQSLGVTTGHLLLGEIWEALNPTTGVPDPAAEPYGREARCRMDDVRIYNRVLSPSEIQVLIGSDRTCADVINDGYQKDTDLTGPDGTPDCRVNLYDLAGMGAMWLLCNNPEDPACVIEPDPEPDPDVTTGLVAYWPLDTDYNDASGYGTPANGTAVGDVALVTDAQRGTVLSVRPNATSMALPAGYVNCGNGSKFNFTSAMTLSFWMKEPAFNPSLDNTWRRVITKGETCWRTGTADAAASANKMQFVVEHNTGTAQDWTSNIWTDDVWIFLTCVWDQGAVTVYANGEIAVDYGTSGTTIDQNTAPVVIGEIWEAISNPGGESYGRPFRGFFDDVCLYNRALTQEQVQFLMTSGIPEEE